MTSSDVKFYKKHAFGTNRTELIDQIVSGEWYNPELKKTVEVDYDSIVFEESLDGGEADLVASLNLGSTFCVVADRATHDALGSRVAGNLSALGGVNAIVLENPHADMKAVDDLRVRMKPYEGVVAVGSGTINDLRKYAAYLDGRDYCVFGTAASMNGYTSSTASINLDSGLKVSLPAKAPRGFFVDLKVSADAPANLTAAGFGDCLARSVAQIDWWMSHRMLGTTYMTSPYLIQMKDEAILNDCAGLLPGGDIDAITSLYRVLTLCGLGIAFTGMSNHGSMGEHQISHYIDCFARERHPGTLHGQQVGVAALTMARLQQRILSSDTPPYVSPPITDIDDMSRRMGSAIARECLSEWKKKAFTGESANIFNARLDRIWPELRTELSALAIPAEKMKSLLNDAGGPQTAGNLGLPVDFYREAVCHNHEIRNRFSFVDIAADSGQLYAFAQGET